MLLIAGPSSVGKSTFLRLNYPKANVTYGFEVDSLSELRTDAIHYNVLFHAYKAYLPGSPEERRDLPPQWDFKAEARFQKIITSGRIEKAIVLVAPIAELKQRMAVRRMVEPNNPSAQYPNEQWLHVLSAVDLFAIYERLFDALEASEIPYEVIYSSSPTESTGNPTFLPSDRVYAHLNLRGTYFPTPSANDVRKVTSMPGCEYQIARLPTGLNTNARGFPHVSEGRASVLEALRDKTFANRAVLDIGCAIGDTLFRSERYGATRLLGIELNESRFAAAKALATLLHSSAEIRFGNFLDIELAEKFDDVFALNVIHHVSDFRGFLVKAATLAKERLIVEFPAITDPAFESLIAVSGDISHLPIVGVRSRTGSQMFVFTRAAIERMIGDIGPFEVTWVPSSIPNRELGVFSRTS
jgi:SAM-dependent methyltransferase